MAQNRRNKDTYEETNTENCTVAYTPNIGDQVFTLISTNKLDVNYFTRLAKVAKDFESY
jgi:hypothetical protein